VGVNWQGRTERGVHRTRASEDVARHVQTSAQEALDNAYRYLGHRDRTVAEVRVHLVEKKLVSEDAAEAAIAELIEQGYLDDARFARRFSEDRRNLDSWGNERIERKLLALGVPSDLIGQAVATREAGTELDAAVALLQRRYATPLAGERERQKALGVLVRKGYDLELAYDAVRRFDSGGECSSNLAATG
jgi:regulatory protein